MDKIDFRSLEYSLADLNLNILGFSNRPLMEQEEVSSFNTEEIVMEKIKIEMLYKIIDTLDDIDRKIIFFHFGFVDGKCYSLEEIGNMFGFSVEGVRYHLKKAFTKIRVYQDILSDSLEASKQHNI